MVIVWDEPKRVANPEKHGLDFARFEAMLSEADVLVLPASESRTGRARLRLVLARPGGEFVAAILSPLGSEALALVSLRPASDQEKSAHGER